MPRLKPGPAALRRCHRGRDLLGRRSLGEGGWVGRAPSTVAHRPSRSLRARVREETSARRSPEASQARPRAREATTAGPSWALDSARAGPELLQEAQVVFVEQTDVVHIPLEHRHAFEAHAEGEA